MARYESMFARRAGTGAVVPFIMLGHSSLQATLDAADALVGAGADALELGIPFSDPTADGPVIQRAAQRALEAGATPGACFELIAEIRGRHPTLPIGILAYANVVVRRGVARFYRAAGAAGADSVLVADVPLAECAPFVAAARDSGIAPVLVVPPAPRPGLIERVAELGGGYVYLQGRAGVTGANVPMLAPDASVIGMLDRAGAPPALVGFGVSCHAHLEAALRAGAAGVIVGSAIVAIVERLGAEPAAMRTALGEAMHELRNARPARPVRDDAEMAETR